jgi:hypothetical protein
LRWHRDRYYPVAAQIRAVLPRYRQLSDPEILTARFTLSDAQEFVAKQQGFESWQALKTEVDAVPKPAEKAQSKPVISATAAELFVSDITASCDFFTQKTAGVRVFSDAEEGAVGSQYLHRQRSRRQSAALCRARQLRHLGLSRALGRKTKRRQPR